MTSLASLLVVVIGVGAGLGGCPPARRDVDVSKKSERRSAEVAGEGLIGEVGEPRVRRVSDDPAPDEDDAEAAAQARHARREYRRVLVHELGALDERLAELEGELEEASDDAKPAKRRDLDEGRAWRRLLEQDVEALARVTPRAWRALKRRIARDLGESRPEAFPPWLENAYAM